jgi:hypothetical protein
MWGRRQNTGHRTQGTAQGIPAKIAVFVGKFVTFGADLRLYDIDGWSV